MSLEVDVRGCRGMSLEVDVRGCRGCIGWYVTVSCQRDIVSGKIEVEVEACRWMDIREGDICVSREGGLVLVSPAASVPGLARYAQPHLNPTTLSGTMVHGWLWYMEGCVEWGSEEGERWMGGGDRAERDKRKGFRYVVDG